MPLGNAHNAHNTIQRISAIGYKKAKQRIAYHIRHDSIFLENFFEIFISVKSYLLINALSDLFIIFHRLFIVLLFVSAHKESFFLWSCEKSLTLLFRSFTSYR